MVRDRGLHNASDLDGFIYEDFFPSQKSMEAGSFELNCSQPLVMKTSSLHDPELDASQLFFAQKVSHGHQAGGAQSNYASSVSGSSSSENPSSTSTDRDGDSTAQSETTDIVLSYISQILMEEDVDEKIKLLYLETAALQAAEKPFYDILGQQYPPPSPVQPPLHHEWPEESINSSDLVDPTWLQDSSSNQLPSHPVSQYSFNGEGSLYEPFIVPGMSTENHSAWQFKRGMEEAQKFLPSETQLLVGHDFDRFAFHHEPEEKSILFDTKEETLLDSMPWGRKKPLDLQEGRSNKLSAASSEDALRSEMFDAVLLCHGDNKSGRNNEVAAADDRQMANGGKAQGKRQQKKEAVDLSTLLIYCAQAVAADDRHMANELLKQIRQHSSPFGDGTQRIAQCFADGLEARVAGTGSLIYHSLVAKRTTATDILKAYRLFLSVCPFKRISHFFSNQTIVRVTEKASRVHIIDFGINFGFQWPCLIQRLSSRPGGPPHLRITGIDLPLPGFRPAERIEETGRRLADYAKSFNVPFEYNGIASKWEAITVQDLKIQEDEVVIINCMYRFQNVIDETVIADSPRNKVLKTIKKAKPDIFIHGIVNGLFGAPFFVTRFREALFHYSALFDMLETTVAREDAQRLLIERDLFGREALNVVSCEGSERVERPETYKQWQVRSVRAGFRLVPPIADIMKKTKERVRESYHKEFVIDEDGGWLLQGWKGRIIYALSIWKPTGEEEGFA